MHRELAESQVEETRLLKVMEMLRGAREKGMRSVKESKKREASRRNLEDVHFSTSSTTLYFSPLKKKRENRASPPSGLFFAQLPRTRERGLRG